jgi:ectoine hydroxylase-related dioxygenase (phytanoyl-CoA dioxygenase family)
VKFTTELLRQDIVFEQALMNEVTLALLSYLLGESCILHEMVGFVKGPGLEYLPLHTDQNQNSTPAPFPLMAQIANVTWALTDYSDGDGVTCFAAGSHKLCRHPNADEATDLSLFRPVEAKAGSILIWHGNTWHGALPRINPGFRVSFVMQFARWYHRVREAFAQMLPPEAFARNAPRLAVLTRAGDYGIGGTDSRRVACISPFA